GFVLRQQLPNRDPAQVHESLRLGQKHRFIPDPGSGRQRAALPVTNLDSTLVRNPINCKKAEVMRRELILDARIAETDDQFHALPSPKTSRAMLGRTGEGDRPHTSNYFFSFFSAFFSAGFSAAA